MSAQKPITRMWCFLFVNSILFLTVISKEYAPEVKLGDDELNRIYNMVKRLEKKSGNDPKDRIPVGISGHGDESTADESTGVRSELCGVTENDGSIIRTNDSIHNGAQFLEVFRDALTQGACADRCCEKSPCDTSVFEKEGEHQCFLFHCQGRCQFSRHNNFTSINIHRHESSSPSSTPQPASATAGNSETDRIETSSDSVTSSTPTVSGPATTSVFAHSGGKCPSGSFECQAPVDGNTQCIPQEMVCDSIRQCVDGSDEGSCSHTGPLPTQGGPPNDSSKDAQHMDKEDKQRPGDVSQEAQTDLLEEKKNKTESEKDEHKGGVQKDGKQTAGSTEGQSSETKEETTDEHTTKSSEQPKMESTPSAADSTTPTPMSSTASTSAASTHTDQHFISKEKMDSTEVNDLQMPIIALSVGLAFTLILLIFVACRLCKVRRQLRKGRPLHSNEADYLINGMYL